ncbi:ABC transporter substrate-binding protein [Paenibacillus silviterrae]|uniref:ABC transporter substrate-binding protein n=1 Tax=Paenibacillus silviterrae TaxID=3242194 RepID=UPI002543AFDB|nr:ABC transporter substrate-binding protein [Paenibacillus chinjuensis]
MNWKKVISSAALASVITAALTACGGGGEAVKPADVKPAADDPNEKAELVIYSNSGDSQESWNERFGNALKEKFPNYTITYLQKQPNNGLKELLTAGQTIDIYWDSIGGFMDGLINNGMQLDMTDLAKKHNVDMGRLEPVVADSIKQIDSAKMYGIPVFNNNMVLYYNKDIFDKFGVPYPKDGMTWTEANKLAKEVTRSEAGKQYVGLSSSQTHMLPMNQFSLPFVDSANKPTIFSNEKWKEYFETVFVEPAKAPGYREYMRAHKDAMPYRNEFLKDRELAMFAWLSSIVFVFPEDFQAMNWDMVSLPTFESLPGVGSQPYPTYFAVTSMSKQPDQAMKVIKHLISDEVQMKLSKLGVMPVLKNEEVKKAYGQESKFKDKNLKASFYNKFAPMATQTLFDKTLLTPYAKTVPKLMLDPDYNTVFRAAEEETTKKIEEAQKASK